MKKSTVGAYVISHDSEDNGQAQRPGSLHWCPSVHVKSEETVLIKTLSKAQYSQQMAIMNAIHGINCHHLLKEKFEYKECVFLVCKTIGKSLQWYLEEATAPYTIGPSFMTAIVTQMVNALKDVMISVNKMDGVVLDMHPQTIFVNIDIYENGSSDTDIEPQVHIQFCPPISSDSSSTSRLLQVIGVTELMSVFEKYYLLEKRDDNDLTALNCLVEQICSMTGESNSAILTDSLTQSFANMLLVADQVVHGDLSNDNNSKQKDLDAEVNDSDGDIRMLTSVQNIDKENDNNDDDANNNSANKMEVDNVNTDYSDDMRRENFSDQMESTQVTHVNMTEESSPDSVSETLIMLSNADRGLNQLDTDSFMDSDVQNSILTTDTLEDTSTSILESSNVSVPFSASPDMVMLSPPTTPQIAHPTVMKEGEVVDNIKEDDTKQRQSCEKEIEDGGECDDDFVLV